MAGKEQFDGRFTWLGGGKALYHKLSGDYRLSLNRPQF
jgi:hypothetical protein